MGDKEVATLLISVYLAAHGDLWLAHAKYPPDETTRIERNVQAFRIGEEPYRELLETSVTAAMRIVIPSLH